jgi:hypothetical protein
MFHMIINQSNCNTLSDKLELTFAISVYININLGFEFSTCTWINYFNWPPQRGMRRARGANSAVQTVRRGRQHQNGLIFRVSLQGVLWDMAAGVRGPGRHQKHAQHAHRAYTYIH